MDETRIRWRGRLGSLKGLGFIIVVFLVLILIAVGQDLVRGLQSPAQPVTVSIDELNLGGRADHPYVSVAGTAYYEVGYSETEYGRTVASYFLLLSEKSGQGMIVQASNADIDERVSGEVTLTGTLRDASSDLQTVVRSDLPYFAQEGVTVDPTYYLAEGDRPLDALTTLLLLAGAAVIGVLAVTPFFFPTTVYAPHPVDSLASSQPAIAGRAAVRATGWFTQLKKLEPALEFGKRKQSFTNAVANLVRTAEGRWMIYIHHVVRTRLYGVVPISKHESDWGMILDRGEGWQVEPGKIYGWKDRWAVRFQKPPMGAKPDPVYLVFDRAADQAEFVKAVRDSGFSVGTGMGY